MRTRNNMIRFRLSDSEVERFDHLVKKSGLSREAYLRQIIAGLQPRDQPPPDYRLFMRQFYSIGNSLNQIARKAHALNVIDTQKYDEEIAKYHDALTRVEEAVICPEKVD